MDAIGVILVAAVIIEAILQVVKSWVPEHITTPGWLWPVCGAVLGAALCLLGSMDLLSAVGIRLSLPMIGELLTGVLISRGASFVHDLWGKIRGEYEINQASN